MFFIIEVKLKDLQATTQKKNELIKITSIEVADSEAANYARLDTVKQHLQLSFRSLLGLHQPWAFSSLGLQQLYSPFEIVLVGTKNLASSWFFQFLSSLVIRMIFYQ